MAEKDFSELKNRVLGMEISLRKEKELREQEELEKEAIAFDEKNGINEMAIQTVSDDSDGLPFAISVKAPEKVKTYHAHIMKKGVKGVELGTFEITKNPPKEVKDLVDYVAGPHKGLKGISEKDRQLIVDWAGRKNNSGFPGTNWEALRFLYAVALRSI